MILATGYEIDVGRYDFLARDLVANLDTVDGYPRLASGYESSVRGLHFVGATATFSYGPVMQFIVGSWHAAPAVRRAGRSANGNEPSACRTNPESRFALPFDGRC